MNDITPINFTQRNNAIDIFRLACAVYVVSSHVSLFGNLFNGLFTCFLISLAVPYFFVIAGYYYIRSLIQGKAVFLKTALGLLQIYTFWSVVYFVLQYIKYVHGMGMPLDLFLKKLVVQYFLLGSHPHLWFVPVLFYSLCLVTLLHKLHALKIAAFFSIILYLIGCLGCPYYPIGNQIPLISDIINSPYFHFIRRMFLMGFPFVMTGYFLNIAMQRVIPIPNSKIIPALCISVLFWLVETVLIATYISPCTVITLFLHPTLALIVYALLQNPMAQKTTLGFYCKVMANFIYFAHPVFLGLEQLFPLPTHSTILHNALLFTFAVASTSVIGYLIARSRNKWLMKYVA